MSDEDYKRRRERNNQSVQLCRAKEKQKVDAARKEVDKFKNENKTLKEKLSSMQKELGLLKSLFSQNSSAQSASVAVANSSCSEPNSLATTSAQLNDNGNSSDSDNDCKEDANLKTIKKRKKRESISKSKQDIISSELKKSQSLSQLFSLNSNANDDDDAKNNQQKF